MADGFSLNIDAKFLRDLQRIDEKYQKLMDKNNQLSKSVISAYQEMSSKGVTPYVKKLQEQKEALEAIANIKLSKGAGADMRALQDGANKAVDNINRLLNVLKNTQQYQKETSTFSDASKVNALYSERIELMRRLEGYVQKGMKGELVTEQESNSISVFRQRLMNIDSEIKAIQNMKTISTDVYMALIKGEIDFTNAKNAEIQKRNAITNQFKDEEKKKNQQIRDDIFKYEQDKFNESLNQYRKNKDTQASVDKHYHDKRQREYEEMFRKIDELAKRESEMRSKSYSRIQSSGDTSKQATAAYNRLYSDKGIKSLNNMNRVLQQLQDAQNKLNLKTKEGKKQYDELGKKIQKVKEDIDKATNSNQKFGNSQSKLLNTSDQLQRKLALLFSVSAIQGYMDKLVNVRKEFELQQKSLQVLLRDKDQADKLWQQTLDLAVKSPFRIKELVSYTKQLAAYRIETSKLHDTTKMLSDVSAGLGVDMQRIILAFGQVRAANFLRGTELRQFTEAGIPMLDELAKLFTELEGRAVSAGDVFERISKRMVSFKDVEEVFKRMTSESGVFYNMQEEQSKTLAGMISNLRDSVDLMLNDIGRANDTTIKDMVSAVRNLVDNWRMMAIVLKQVGVSLLAINIVNFTRGWVAASTALTAADITMKGVAGTAGKLRVALTALGNTMKAHPIYLLIGVVASASHAMWEYRKAIVAANEKYDDMSRREIKRIDKLEELQKKTSEYNATIKDSNKTEKERNKAIQENDKIFGEIKSKYPDLLSYIKKQEDGTIDLTKAVEEQNRVLIENIALQQKAKGGLFQDTLDENYKDAIEAYNKMQGQIADFQVVAIDAQSKLRSAQGISNEDYERFSSLLLSIRQAKTFEEVRDAYQALIDEIRRSGKEISKQVPMLGMFAEEWLFLVNKADDYNTSLNRLQKNLENQSGAIRLGIQNAYDKAYKEAGGEGKEAEEAGKKAAGKWIEGFLDDFGIIDKNIREWAKIKIPKFVTVDVIYPTKTPTPQELEPWAKRVKAAVTKLNEEIKSKNKNAKESDLFPLPEPGQTKEQYLNVAKAVLEVAKATYREGQQIEEEDTVKRTNILKSFASQYEAIANIEDKNKNKGKDWMSEVIKGVKEAHQEYIKLNKTLSATESKQMALKKYSGVFAEAAKNAGLKGISLGDLTFETEQGTIDALNYLKDKLPSNAKIARLKIEQALSDIVGEVRVKTKIESDKELVDSIEEMFGNYEVSLELEKLNIPPDLAKQLFKLDTTSLSDIRSKIQSEIDAIGTTPTKDKGQQDRLEKLKEFLKKVDDMETEAQEERLKKYVKYLLQAQSERVKIKLEEMRQLAEIEKLGFNETQKEQITQSIQLETKQKMDKAEWEAFKDTDLYVQMFEDLGVVSDKVLSDLKTRLIDIRGSLSDLSPRELKEVVSQLEKVTSEQISRNPFENLGDTIDKGVKALKRLNKEQEEYSNALKEQDVTQKRVDSLQIANKQAEAQIESAKAILLSKDATIEQRNEAQHIITVNNDSIKQNNLLLDVEIKRLATQKGITEEAAKKLILTREEVSELNKTANSVGAWGSTITDSVSQITGMLENWGIDFGEEFKEILSGVGQMFNSLESIDLTKPMSIITGATNFISGLGNTLASLFGFGNKDKKKEKQIQREIKFVEDLQRAYEKLEKDIDNAYSINTLQASGQAAKKNIDAQIASYNKMIAAEEDKKKTDKDRIKEWELAIEDLIEQKAELDKQLVSTATSGIMDDVLSASQEFTNAWLEAFNETGDGLRGLENNFKDTMLEMVKQQAAMLITQAYVEKWKNNLANYINADDLELTTDEAKKWVDSVTSSLPMLNDALENYFTAMQQAGVELDSTGELSGLQRGIQGVTEETAQIIEAYMASVRFYVADSNSKLTMIANQIIGSDETTNPMLSELRSQTELIRSIRDMFGSVIKQGHSTFGGAFLKVSL